MTSQQSFTTIFKLFHNACKQGSIPEAKDILNQCITRDKSSKVALDSSEHWSEQLLAPNSLMNLTALHVAVKRKYSVEVFKWLLSLNPSLANVGDAKGKTVLHLAVESNQFEYVKTLIRQSHDDIRLMIDYNAVTSDESTVLHFAAATSNHDMLEYLLEHGRCDQTKSNQNGWSSVYIAINKGDEKAVQIFANKCGIVTIDIMDDNGFPPCHQAVRLGHLNVLTTLIQLGASPLKRIVSNQWTLLHSAVSNDQIEIVKYLLKERIGDINAKSSTNATPLHLAVGRNTSQAMKIVTLLLDMHSIDVHTVNDDGFSALHVAASIGSIDMCTLLMMRGNIDSSKLTNVKVKDLLKDGRHDLHHLDNKRQAYYMSLDRGASAAELAEINGFHDCSMALVVLVKALRLKPIQKENLFGTTAAFNLHVLGDNTIEKSSLTYALMKSLQETATGLFGRKSGNAILGPGCLNELVGVQQYVTTVTDNCLGRAIAYNCFDYREVQYSDIYRSLFPSYSNNKRSLYILVLPFDDPTFATDNGDSLKVKLFTLLKLLITARLLQTKELGVDPIKDSSRIHVAVILQVTQAINTRAQQAIISDALNGLQSAVSQWLEQNDAISNHEESMVDLDLSYLTLFSQPLPAMDFSTNSDDQLSELIWKPNQTKCLRKAVKQFVRNQVPIPVHASTFKERYEIVSQLIDFIQSMISLENYGIQNTPKKESDNTSLNILMTKSEWRSWLMTAIDTFFSQCCRDDNMNDQKVVNNVYSKLLDDGLKKKLVRMLIKYCEDELLLKQQNGFYLRIPCKSHNESTDNYVVVTNQRVLQQIVLSDLRRYIASISTSSTAMFRLLVDEESVKQALTVGPIQNIESELSTSSKRLSMFSSPKRSDQTSSETRFMSLVNRDRLPDQVLKLLSTLSWCEVVRSVNVGVIVKESIIPHCFISALMPDLSLTPISTLTALGHQLPTTTSQHGYSRHELTRLFRLSPDGLTTDSHLSSKLVLPPGYLLTQITECLIGQHGFQVKHDTEAYRNAVTLNKRSIAKEISSEVHASVSIVQIDGNSFIVSVASSIDTDSSKVDHHFAKALILLSVSLMNTIRMRLFSEKESRRKLLELEKYCITTPLLSLITACKLCSFKSSEDMAAFILQTVCLPVVKVESQLFVSNDVYKPSIEHYFGYLQNNGKDDADFIMTEVYKEIPLELGCLDALQCKAMNDARGSQSVGNSGNEAFFASLELSDCSNLEDVIHRVADAITKMNNPQLSQNGLLRDVAYQACKVFGLDIAGKKSERDTKISVIQFVNILESYLTTSSDGVLRGAFSRSISGSSSSSRRSSMRSSSMSRRASFKIGDSSRNLSSPMPSFYFSSDSRSSLEERIGVVDRPASLTPQSSHSSVALSRVSSFFRIESFMLPSSPVNVLNNELEQGSIREGSLSLETKKMKKKISFHDRIVEEGTIDSMEDSDDKEDEVTCYDSDSDLLESPTALTTMGCQVLVGVVDRNESVCVIS